MKELNDIILAYDKAVAQNKRTALATVVHVEGSSYRRPGARMLVTEDGEITGAISGGCLEGDALRKAQFAIIQQQNKLVVYDTTDEDDLKFGVQLGCNGIVYVLFEPIISDTANNPINLLKYIVENRQDSVLATLFNLTSHVLQKGTGCYVSKNKSIFINDELKPLLTECSNVLSNKSSVVKHYKGSCSALFQFIAPALQLVIIGAGNDVQPVTEMAHLLGWRIIVIDGRATHATQQRFIKANKVIVSKSKDVVSKIYIDEQTAFILMTHNYNYDIAVLEQLLVLNCAYVGVLGPKKKLHRMFDELSQKGIDISDEQLNKIYGPVGLDIGAETAEEIAVSIIAEIQTILRQRSAGSLKNKTEAIHSLHAILNA